MGFWGWFFSLLGGGTVLVAIYDLLQTKHAILRNFPVIGHFRYIFEAIGPELRQYIVTNNDEERPFSRDQRRWVYSTAKKQNSYFGFGTDNDLEVSTGYMILKQSTFPHAAKGDDPLHLVECGKVLGGSRSRPHAFRPDSIFCVSAMSYGSLSAPAVRAINKGCALSECLHNTGEGGIAPHHDQGGGLIYQLGTGYFGARAEDGGFSLERFKDTVAAHDVKMIEVKLSQGAKPGKGGVLPAAKVTSEIAQVRGIPVGKSCLSPSGHRAFHDADSLLDFVEMLAEETGLPIGIKSAVGQTDFFEDLARLMESGIRGVDAIAVDGGEGGTGAAPLAFSDHVALPFKLGMSRVYPIFARRGIADRIVFFGAGRLGFPIQAVSAMALGCDMVAMAREPMMAIGCIQAQRCHSGHCPTGVATQSKWLMRGLDPEDKAARLANYLIALRKEVLDLAHAAGVPHPACLGPEHLEVLDPSFRSEAFGDLFGYDSGWKRLSEQDARRLQEPHR